MSKSILPMCQVALTWFFPASPLEALNGAIVDGEQLLLPPQHRLGTLCTAEPCQSWERCWDPLVSTEHITSVALFPFLRPN